jgi:N-acetylmuramic acid 6-phosphate etherase
MSESRVSESRMSTEHISPRYVDLDAWPVTEMIAAMYEGQLAAAAAVGGALGAIAAAVADAVPALQRGGRIIYTGAGTSGRIGVQDGSELAPTFDWPAERVVFAIAGGLDAIVRSAERAEDDEAAGAQAMTAAKVGANDVVVGVAASGTTPYTIGALRAATAAGAVTIAVANNRGVPLLGAARHRILVDTGSEAIAGSTRMKAGTAQKIVLNLLSTAVMVRMGRVHRGLMVDMRASNAKLRRRAVTIVGELLRCAESDAARHLEQADGDVKTAVLLGLGLGRGDAAQLLRRHDGNLRKAIDAPRATGHGACAPSPPSGGEGRDEGAPPQTVSSRLADRPPHPLKGERERQLRPSEVGRNESCTATAMACEIAEIPDAAARLLARSDALESIATRIERARPRMVVFCGRGSSGHVGVYLRYLVEARLGLLVSNAAPSVVTAYRRPPDMRDALFVLVSQSGRSPDLVTATRVARQAGALTLAIVNDETSPAAAESELVLPVGAGPEHAVAATKTVALSMIAGARLVARLARDDDLGDGLRHLPPRLARALACDWSGWADRAADAAVSFVAGRGYALGSVREIALKVAETLRVPALGYSAAELRHGPRASITPATPVLVLRQNDEAAAAVDGLVRDLIDAGETVFTAGGPAGTLPWIGDGHPMCDPVVMLIPAYRAIETAARRQGFDPDNPPHLSKVTQTL